jgi:formamidopyrimidine-DNA glycosylase
MPELPEVEVVRRGLQAHVAGKTITAVRVHHPRAVRRHEAGATDLTARLLGACVEGTDRRGKYLWLNLIQGGTVEEALVVHLGMSGQMLLGPISNTDHLRIAVMLDDGTALSFVDQRTFGGWQVADLVSVDGSRLPAPVAHIARDPLDPRFDQAAVVNTLRRKHSEIKRQLSIRRWCRASATSTPTRRCGGPGSTARESRPISPVENSETCSTPPPR